VYEKYIFAKAEKLLQGFYEVVEQKKIATGTVLSSAFYIYLCV
jgi:hypothetical protein